MWLNLIVDDHHCGNITIFYILNAAPHSPPECILILGQILHQWFSFWISFLFSANCKICNIEIANWDFSPFLRLETENFWKLEFSDSTIHTWLMTKRAHFKIASTRNQSLSCIFVNTKNKLFPFSHTVHLAWYNGGSCFNQALLPVRYTTHKIHILKVIFTSDWKEKGIFLKNININ